jgi:hypothetical protein
MDRRCLEWTVTALQTPAFRVMNALSPRMPLRTWQSPRLVRTREQLAHRFLGLGDILLSGPMPSGHQGTLMPERMYIIGQATAVLDGVDLGHAARVKSNPMIGALPLLAPGVLAVGRGTWQILENNGGSYDTDSAARHGRPGAAGQGGLPPRR